MSLDGMFAEPFALLIQNESLHTCSSSIILRSHMRECVLCVQNIAHAIERPTMFKDSWIDHWQAPLLEIGLENLLFGNMLSSLIVSKLQSICASKISQVPIHQSSPHSSLGDVNEITLHSIVKIAEVHHITFKKTARAHNKLEEECLSSLQHRDRC